VFKTAVTSRATIGGERQAGVPAPTLTDPPIVSLPESNATWSQLPTRGLGLRPGRSPDANDDEIAKPNRRAPGREDDRSKRRAVSLKEDVTGFLKGNRAAQGGRDAMPPQ